MATNGLKLITAILLLFFASSFAEAQTTVSGKITNEKGEALAFANILIKGTYDGVSSNENGTFLFTTTEKGEVTILASSIGYEGYEGKLTLSDKPITLNIKLKEKTTELNTVVISAGSFEASDKKKAVILRPLDIVTTAGASGDIDGAIKTLPGAQTIGEQEGLFVRGGSSSETKTIIDEMVVQNPYSSSVPDVPSRGRFTPFLFTGTVFSTGGYSALYGQALSSTLVLNTEDLAEESRTALGITVVGVNGGHTHRWKNTSLSIDGGYNNLKPFFALNPQQRDWIKAPESGQGSIILRQKTSATGIFKIYGTFSASTLAIRFPSLYDSNKTMAEFSLKNQNVYVNTSYRELLGRNWSIFVGASYSYNIDKISFNLHNLNSGQRNTQENTQGKFYFTKYFNTNTNLKIGAEVQDIIYGQDSSLTFISTDPLYDPATRTSTHSINEVYGAAFAEVEIFITRKLAARIGERSEYSRILNKENFAPRTSISYKTGKLSQVSFAYGRFYETPQRSELFLSNSLNFEECTHYIANYQVMTDERTFRIEGYYKKYDALVRIFRSPMAGDTGKVYTEGNSGTGYARGIDVFWRDKKTFKNVDYWISYTYLDTKRKYQYYPDLLQPTFATPHTVSVVYKEYVPFIKTSIGLTYTFATGRPYYFFTNPPTYSGPNIEGTTKTYNNLSVNASYLTSIAGNFTVVFMGINNILSINNVYGYRFSPDGAYRNAITPQSLRTLFIGMFISIGTKVAKK
jgi:vitamin B12 transporter